MSKKTIMFFGWLFYPKTGGAETIMLNQAKELVARGYEVTVLTSVLENGVESEENLAGIKVIRRKYVNSREPQEYSVINTDLSKLIERIKPDVFHFHNGSYPSGSNDKSIGVKTILAVFDTVSKFKIPIVEHAHNAQLKDPQDTKPLRELAWDCLICVSKFVKEEWTKLGTGAKLMKVVYNGIDTELFSEAEPDGMMKKFQKENGVILFSPARLFSLSTGKLNKQKNMALVFEALGILVERGVDNFILVSIVNDVYSNEAVENSKRLVDEIIRQKKLEDRVRFIPIIDPNKMPGFYAGADIVCVPALYETFGLMYLEAMAAGKVVIASNTGGPKEYIKNNENGYFVDPENAGELADILEKLIKDKSLRKDIGEKARAEAKNFSVKEMVDGLEEVYEVV